jgi:hypothetical protein
MIAKSYRDQSYQIKNFKTRKFNPAFVYRHT